MTKIKTQSEPQHQAEKLSDFTIFLHKAAYSVLGYKTRTYELIQRNEKAKSYNTNPDKMQARVEAERQRAEAMDELTNGLIAKHEPISPPSPSPKTQKERLGIAPFQGKGGRM